MPAKSASPLSTAQRQDRYRRAKGLQTVNLTPPTRAMLVELRAATGRTTELVVAAGARMLLVALAEGGGLDAAGVFVPRIPDTPAVARAKIRRLRKKVVLSAPGPSASDEEKPLPKPLQPLPETHPTGARSKRKAKEPPSGQKNFAF